MYTRKQGTLFCRAVITVPAPRTVLDFVEPVLSWPADTTTVGSEV